MQPNSIKNIQGYLDEHSLDAFLVLTKLNRQYVSGFTGSMGAVLVTKRGAELYVDDRYTIRAKRQSPLLVKSIKKLSTSPGLRPPSPGLGRGWGRGRIGIEDKISLKEFSRLKKDFKSVKWEVTSNVIENLRAVKTPQEIKYIRKAQAILDKIFVTVKKMSLPGMTELALSQKMRDWAVRFGAGGMAFESIVAFGPNAAAPHHLSSMQKIKRGNFLLLDFGVLVDGYHSDFTRTFFIGTPTRRQETVYNTVLEAQQRGIEKATAGNPAVLIDEAARGHIKRAGFGKYFTHNTGHGVGLEIHELPNFSATSEDILRPNMVVTVEPGIYIENWGGVRIEDMVLVKNLGNEVLPKPPKDFKSMIIK